MKILYRALMAGTFAFALILGGCSKEKQFERSLTKSDGSWNVASADYQHVSQGSSQNIVTATETNVGSFNFSKNGDLKFDFDLNNENFKGSANWSLDEDAIQITSTTQSFSFTGNILQHVIAYNGHRDGKNRIILEGTETKQRYEGGTIVQDVLTAKFILERE